MKFIVLLLLLVNCQIPDMNSTNATLDGATNATNTVIESTRKPLPTVININPTPETFADPMPFGTRIVIGAAIFFTIILLLALASFSYTKRNPSPVHPPTSVSDKGTVDRKKFAIFTLWRRTLDRSRDIYTSPSGALSSTELERNTPNLDPAYDRALIAKESSETTYNSFNVNDSYDIISEFGQSTTHQSFASHGYTYSHGTPTIVSHSYDHSYSHPQPYLSSIPGQGTEVNENYQNYDPFHGMYIKTPQNTLSIHNYQNSVVSQRVDGHYDLSEVGYRGSNMSFGYLHEDPVHKGPVHEDPVHKGPVHEDPDSGMGYSESGYDSALSIPLNSLHPLDEQYDWLKACKTERLSMAQIEALAQYNVDLLEQRQLTDLQIAQLVGSSYF
jgi:hypothetical protein